MKEYISYEDAVELVKDRCLNPSKYTFLEIGEAYVLADKFFEMTKICEIAELKTIYIPYWNAACYVFKEYLLAHEEKAMQQLVQKARAVLNHVDKAADTDWADIMAVCYAYLCVIDKKSRTHIFWNQIYNAAAVEMGLPDYVFGCSFLASRQETKQQKDTILQELKNAKSETEVNNLLDTLNKVNKYLKMSEDS